MVYMHVLEETKIVVRHICKTCSRWVRYNHQRGTCDMESKKRDRNHSCKDWSERP